MDEAYEQGGLDYKTFDQLAAVPEIVKLVTAKPPIAVISILIESSNLVTNCRRFLQKLLTSFVSCFPGLVAFILCMQES